MVTSPALAQDENALPAAETAEIVPLFKMKKPELKIVYTKQPETPIEDVVVATGSKTKTDVKVNNPVICKELTVPDFGKYNNGSRLRKTQNYCNHRNKWDVKEREVLKEVKDISGL